MALVRLDKKTKGEKVYLEATEACGQIMADFDIKTEGKAYKIISELHMSSKYFQNVNILWTVE
jgi:hypothetical protein